MSVLLQIFLNLCIQYIVISITVSAPEKSYMEYSRMPSIYSYVITLFLSLPIRCPRVFISVSVRNNILIWQNFTILTPLSLLSWCRLSFQLSVWIYPLHNFSLKSSNRIFMWLKIHFNFSKKLSLNHQFSPHFLDARSKNDVTPATSQNYIWHPITNKPYSLHCW